MAATVVLTERNGPFASSIETVDVSNVNFGSDDSAELTPATYPIVAKADGHAYEKWLRLYVSALGGSTIVDNIKVWVSNTGGGWGTGVSLSTNLRETSYAQKSYPAAGPVDTNSPDADQSMPETEPSGANLGISGSLSGQITSVPAYSDYCVLQLDVLATTPAGVLNQRTITLQFDEQ